LRNQISIVIQKLQSAIDYGQKLDRNIQGCPANVSKQPSSSKVIITRPQKEFCNSYKIKLMGIFCWGRNTLRRLVVKQIGDI